MTILVVFFLLLSLSICTKGVTLNAVPIDAMQSIYEKLPPIDIAALMQINRVHRQQINQQSTVMHRYDTAKLHYYFYKFGSAKVFEKAVNSGEPKRFLGQLLKKQAPTNGQKQALMIRYAQDLREDLIRAMLQLGVPLTTLDYPLRKTWVQLNSRAPEPNRLMRTLGRLSKLFIKDRQTAEDEQELEKAKRQSDLLQRIYTEFGGDLQAVLARTVNCRSIACHWDLKKAVKNGQLDLVENLLAQGARFLDKPKVLLESVASNVRSDENVAMYWLILQHGVHYSPEINVPLLLTWSPSIFKLMFGFWLLDIRTHGLTMAHSAICAAKLGHLNVLLEGGVTATGELLLLAIERSQLTTIRLLVTRGADVHFDNNLPLRQAVQKRYWGIAQEIFMLGSDEQWRSMVENSHSKIEGYEEAQKFIKSQLER